MFVIRLRGITAITAAVLERLAVRAVVQTIRPPTRR